jgi:hypothetical protein
MNRQVAFLCLGGVLQRSWRDCEPVYARSPARHATSCRFLARRHLSGVGVGESTQAYYKEYLIDVEGAIEAVCKGGDGGEPGNQGLTLLQVGDDTPFPCTTQSSRICPDRLESNAHNILTEGLALRQVVANAIFL